MRTVFLATYVRGADAVGLQLIEWIRLLVEQGHDVQLYVERIGSGVPQDVLALTQAVGDTRLDRSCYWSYVQSADLVVCDYPAYYPLLECVRLLSGPAIIFSYHGITPPQLWQDPDARIFLERSRRRAGLVYFADIALARSQFTRQELHNLTGYPLQRISIVPYIVPAPLPKPAKPLAGARPLILSVGRVAPHKRPEMLVDALALLREDVPGARLVLAGDTHGPAHTAVLAAIRARITALGLTDGVLFAGEANGAALENLYASADLLATASAHEGFCIPVVEAMARGVPVVATATGALPETVGDAGLLVPDEDIPALADAMRRVLQDRELRQTLVARGYRRAQRFRPPAVVEELVRSLERLLERGDRQPGLPRLSQLIDLPALDAAAEVDPAISPVSGRIPLVSDLAFRARAWFTADIRRQVQQLTERQVAYNRQVAQAVRAIDELSATISERQATTRERGNDLSIVDE